MSKVNANNKTRTIVRAVVTRADGTIEDLGIISDSNNKNNKNIEEVAKDGISNTNN